MKIKEPTLVEGVCHWRCSVCKHLFPGERFYKRKKAINGLTSRCRKCHMECVVRTTDKINARRLNREAMRRARKADPEKFQQREREYDHKRKKGKAHKARERLSTAVRSGKIVKPSKCAECWRGHKLTAHHENYDLPYEVEWLCYECHGRRHWKENEGGKIAAKRWRNM